MNSKYKYKDFHYSQLEDMTISTRNQVLDSMISCAMNHQNILAALNNVIYGDSMRDYYYYMDLLEIPKEMRKYQTNEDFISHLKAIKKVE
jgi:hypothetical protein